MSSKSKEGEVISVLFFWMRFQFLVEIRRILNWQLILNQIMRMVMCLSLSLLWLMVFQMMFFGKSQLSLFLVLVFRSYVMMRKILILMILSWKMRMLRVGRLSQIWRKRVRGKMNNNKKIRRRRRRKQNLMKIRKVKWKSLLLRK